MTLKHIFGTNVRHHRRAKGMTQEALAERVGLSMETISKIERGASAPSFATAEEIAVALEVASQVLFGFGEDAIPQGARGRALVRINALLSTMSDGEIARAAKLLEAFANG